MNIWVSEYGDRSSRTVTYLSQTLAALLFVLGLALPVSMSGQGLNRTEDVTFFSTALNKNAEFSVVIPAQAPPAGGYSVLVILHGLGRTHRTLLENADTLALLEKQNYLIVLPDSGKGWWLDSTVSGAKYESMLTEVLQQVEQRYHVSTAPERWGIAGWSMGGFGAVHFAERHASRFGFVGSIIGLLDFPRTDLPEGQNFRVDTSVFGSDAGAWGAENPSQHVKALAGKKVVVVIADEAFDRTMNENFLQQARVAGLQPEVVHIPGGHIFSSVAQGLEILLPRATSYFASAGSGAH